MEILYIILGITISVWLLTSAKTRKSVGSDMTESLHITTKSLKDSLKMNQKKNIIEFASELNDEGYTLQGVEDLCGEFDRIMYNKGA